MAKPLEIPVTQAGLKALLTYFPETGEFVWNYCADKFKFYAEAEIARLEKLLCAPKWPVALTI